MQISKIYNTNFNGIKLSSNKFEKVRDIAFHLQKTGFESLGHKTVACSNTINDKIKTVRGIRSLTNFENREFGALFLPWSAEAYIIAAPNYEQLIYPVIKQYDKGAELNLAI